MHVCTTCVCVYVNHHEPLFLRVHTRATYAAQLTIPVGRRQEEEEEEEEEDTAKTPLLARSY